MRPGETCPLCGVDHGRFAEDFECPSQQHILAEMARISAGWSEEERIKRRLALPAVGRFAQQPAVLEMPMISARDLGA